MSVLNIRGVPEAVARKLKAEAAAAGMTLRGWVLKRLGTEETEPVSEKPKKISKTKAKGSGVAVGIEADRAPVKLCYHGVAVGEPCYKMPCGGKAK
jgi:hypothetical protein